MKIFVAILALAAMAMAEESGAEKALYDANNQFTARFFSEVVKSNPGKSVVLSAYSVLSPLAQLALASVGESHDEILKTIGLPNDNVTKEAFTEVNAKQRKVSGIELKTANRIYVANGFNLNDEFGAVSRDVFNSDVKSVNFGQSEETAKTINEWVEENTNRRIKDLVSADSLSTDTRAVLVNALYFKGTWKDPFETRLTADRDFHVSADKTIKVPTMYRKGDYKYGESEELDAKLLEIPYEGYEASFLVILPNKIDGIAALEEKLKDPAAVDKAVGNMYTHEVIVQLPKFKIETTTNLKDVLSEMGLTKMFSPDTARLEKLLNPVDDGLYISDAIQKAFIEVNEEGAEAAAANAFKMTLTSSRRIVVSFQADRAFYFELKIDHVLIFNGFMIIPENEDNNSLITLRFPNKCKCLNK